MFELTEIDLFGFILREPMTTLTDLITAFVCFFAFYKLTSQNSTGSIQSRFRFYFLLMGLTTFNAAFFSHGILHLVTPNWKVIGWSFSAFSILMLELGSIEHGKSFLGETKVKYLRIFSFIQIAGFFVLMMIPETRSFNVIKMNSTIGMVFIALPIQALIYSKTQSEGSKIVGLAIVAGLLPALVFNLELTLHKYFNFHDISHVLMSIIMFIMYTGFSKVFDDLDKRENKEEETVEVLAKETMTTH